MNDAVQVVDLEPYREWESDDGEVFRLTGHALEAGVVCLGGRRYEWVRTPAFCRPYGRGWFPPVARRNGRGDIVAHTWKRLVNGSAG